MGNCACVKDQSVEQAPRRSDKDKKAAGKSKNPEILSEAVD